MLRYLLLLNQDELSLAKSDEVPFVERVFTKEVPLLTSFQQKPSYTAFLVMKRATAVNNDAVLQVSFRGGHFCGDLL